jgi:hypothetical protein
MEDARRGHRATVEHAAARIGRERMAQFQECRNRLARLWPPSGCTACHSAACAWLDELIAVCQLLQDVGRSGDLVRLRHVDDILGESRVHARRFNAEYASLSVQLRTIVEQARQVRQYRVALAS